MERWIRMHGYLRRFFFLGIRFVYAKNKRPDFCSTTLSRKSRFILIYSSRMTGRNRLISIREFSCDLFIDFIWRVILFNDIRRIQQWITYIWKQNSELSLVLAALYREYFFFKFTYFISWFFFYKIYYKF